MSLLVGPMVHDPYRRKRSTKMKDANVAVPTGLLDSLPATIAVRHSAVAAPVHVYAAIRSIARRQDRQSRFNDAPRSTSQTPLIGAG